MPRRRGRNRRKFKFQIGVIKLFTQKYRVRSYHVDRNGIAKPAFLLQEMQDAGDRQMFTEKPSYHDFLQEGKSFMLSRIDMVFHREIRMDDVIDVSSWPCQGRRATFPRCYHMEIDGKTVAEAFSHWTLVGVEDRKILTVEDADFSRYTMGEPKNLMKGKLRITGEEAEAMEAVCQKKICYSDIDCNGHMNNTYYMNLLCDWIPELDAQTHRVSYARIHYSKEAPLGDTVTVRRLLKEPGVYLFQTRKEDGEVNIEAEIGVTPVSSQEK